MSFWRTRHGTEADFIIGDDIAIEVKSTDNPTDRPLAGLRAIGDERTFSHRIPVFDGGIEAAPRLVNGIDVLPVGVFLQRLWEDAFHRSD